MRTAHRVDARWTGSVRIGCLCTCVLGVHASPLCCGCSCARVRSGVLGGRPDHDSLPAMVGPTTAAYTSDLDCYRPSSDCGPTGGSCVLFPRLLPCECGLWPGSCHAPAPGPARSGPGLGFGQGLGPDRRWSGDRSGVGLYCARCRGLLWCVLVMSLWNLLWCPVSGRPVDPQAAWQESLRTALSRPSSLFLYLGVVSVGVGEHRVRDPDCPLAAGLAGGDWAAWVRSGCAVGAAREGHRARRMGRPRYPPPPVRRRQAASPHHRTPRRATPTRATPTPTPTRAPGAGAGSGRAPAENRRRHLALPLPRLISGRSQRPGRALLSRNRPRLPCGGDVSTP